MRECFYVFMFVPCACLRVYIFVLFIFVFCKSFLYFLTAQTNTGCRMNPRNKIGNPAHRRRRFKQVPEMSAYTDKWTVGF